MTGDGPEPTEPGPEDAAAAPPAVPPGDDVEPVQPDELVLRITDDRALVLSAPGTAAASRWGRLLGEPSRAEIAALVRGLDPVARALVEAKRLTGTLVELHPKDRDMFHDGFKAIAEDDGWLQANFRDRGQVTRLMRIRPATAAAATTSGALALAAAAANAQAAELGQDVKAIGQRIEQLHRGAEDDLASTAANATEQVDNLVELLRAHGADGVADSDVSTVRNELGKASRKILRRLTTAVEDLEAATGLPTATEARDVVSDSAAQRVNLYLDLVDTLEAATVQFGYAQVAYDCHTGKPDVAVTRAEQVTRHVEQLRRDADDAYTRLAALHANVHGQLLPWWKLAGKELAASAGLAAVGAAGSGVIAAGPAVATDGPSTDSSKTVARTAAAGAALGLATGIVRGTKNTVHELRAKAPVQELLEQLAAAGTERLEARTATTPALNWLHQLTKELAPPDS